MAKCSAKDFFDAHTMFFFKEMQFATVEDESRREMEQKPYPGVWE
jgi:hypothetical protein